MAIDDDASTIEFRTQLFGFAKADVRAFIANLLAEYDQARQSSEQLAREFNRAQLHGRTATAPEPTPAPASTPAPAPSSSPAPLQLVQPAEVSVVAERMLAGAYRVAEETRKSAEEEAERVVSDANARAARILESAVAEAAETRTAAMNHARDIEREIELLETRRREMRKTLEMLVSSLAGALDDVRHFSAVDDDEHVPAHASRVLAS